MCSKLLTLLGGLVSLVVALSACSPTATLVPMPVQATAAASLSTKGRIAFYSEGTGIFVINADGGGLTFLTDLGSQPVWSPDAQKIAFISPSELYVMNADGSHQTRLTKDIKGEGRGSVDSPPTWSPDGREIAFDSIYGYGTIYAIGVDGNGLRKITFGEDSRGPIWSPNGQQIAFTYLRKHHTPFRIAVVNADAPPIRWRVLSGSVDEYCERGCPNNDDNPVWSPDSQQIAFVSTRDGNWEIYVMNADGSNLTPLTHNGGRNPVWSPDGRHIAFVSGRDGNDEIYVMNADGSNQTRLTTNPADDHSPSWSPDGRQIAFISNRDGHQEIYVMDADGSNQKRLTDSLTDKWSPVWAPR